MDSTHLPKRGRPRDEELPERRRSVILDAAAPIFAEFGYAGTDLQLVAVAAGVGKGTLYRYFPSKQELFLATVDRGMDRLTEVIDAATIGQSDAIGRTEAAVLAYLMFFQTNPAYVELLIQERAEFRDRRPSTYFRRRDLDGKECEWEVAFAQLMEAGRVRRVPVSRIMDVLGDLIYGTMVTNHLSGRRKPLDEQARDILDVVFFGILTAPERRRRGVTETDV